MLDSFWVTVDTYWNFYGDYIQQQWHHMTPPKYAALLIGIGVFGFLLMKSGNK